ncbi:MAG: ABC transporter transmembrane domain-containing protein, partial [Acidobacteriota bacterium]
MSSDPLFYFLRRYWKLNLLAFCASLLVALFETLNLGMILPLLASLFNVKAPAAESGSLMLWLNQAISFVPVKDKLVAACILLISASLLKFAMSFVQEYTAAYLGGKILHETKKELLAKYCRMPYSFFLERKQGDLKHVVLLGT